VTARRVATVFLLLYLAFDYSDPSVPGVFCFDADAFYLDGVVDGRCATTPATPITTPPATGTRAASGSAIEHGGPAPGVPGEAPSARIVAMPHRSARRSELVAPSDSPTEDH
jgi:hypothetical protein